MIFLHSFWPSCDGGDGSWPGYLHTGLMFLFTGFELRSCRGMPVDREGGMVPMRANRGYYIYIRGPVRATVRVRIVSIFFDSSKSIPRIGSPGVELIRETEVLIFPYAPFSYAEMLG